MANPAALSARINAALPNIEAKENALIALLSKNDDEYIPVTRESLRSIKNRLGLDAVLIKHLADRVNELEAFIDSQS